MKPKIDAEGGEQMKLKIDAKEYEAHISDIDANSVSVEMAVNDDMQEWILFKDARLAGIAARESWVDMALTDKASFITLVGADTLISWALESIRPGYLETESLTEWLDLWLDMPHNHFASYDHEEHNCDFVYEGERYTVAYRVS